MYPLDFKSAARLESCHENIQKILLELTKYADFAVICGHRSVEDQDKAFREGRSKLRGGKSKHNIFPSTAVDIAPKIDGKTEINDRELLCFLIGRVFQIADQYGIALRWGNDWDMDGNISERDPGKDSWDDLYHIELLS